MVFAKNNGCVLDGGIFAHGRFNLAQFNTEAADLHLVINAAMKQNVSAFSDGNGIAGAVKNFVRGFFVKWIGDEFLRGQISSAEITIGNSWSTD